MDSGAGNPGAALSLRNFPGLFLISLPIALVALPSLAFFLRGRWLIGVLVALIMGIGVWGVLQLAQSQSPPTVRESIWLFPRVTLIMGGWVMLVSFPAAVLFRYARQQRQHGSSA